jgi:hypothetical protein
MTACGFIAGYAALWIGWSSLVAALHSRSGKSARPFGPSRSACLMGEALAPVVALVGVAHWTAWIPEPMSAMLTLMTPVLTAAFVARQFARPDPDASRVSRPSLAS